MKIIDLHEVPFSVQTVEDVVFRIKSPSLCLPDLGGRLTWGGMVAGMVAPAAQRPQCRFVSDSTVRSTAFTASGKNHYFTSPPRPGHTPPLQCTIVNPPPAASPPSRRRHHQHHLHNTIQAVAGLSHLKHGCHHRPSSGSASCDMLRTSRQSISET